MTQRVIVLPNGKTVSLSAYAKAWQAVSHAPSDKCFGGFGDVPQAAREILKAMRAGLADRINRHIPGFGRGRKWSDEYFIKAYRDSRRLRGIARRIRVYQFETTDARARFSHLLSSHTD